MFNKKKEPEYIADIYKFINQARTDPQGTAERIKTLYLDPLEGKGKVLEDIMDEEGKKALDEAYEFMKAAKPLPKLKINTGLVAAAYLHASWMAKEDTLAHDDSEGRDFDDRIKLYGKFEGRAVMSESVLAKNIYQPEVWVLENLIDDSLEERPHRNIIMSDDVHLLGVCVKKTEADDFFYLCMTFSSDDYLVNNGLISNEIKDNSGYQHFLDTVGQQELAELKAKNKENKAAKQ